MPDYDHIPKVRDRTFDGCYKKPVEDQAGCILQRGDDKLDRQLVSVGVGTAGGLLSTAGFGAHIGAWAPGLASLLPVGAGLMGLGVGDFMAQAADSHTGEFWGQNESGDMSPMDWAAQKGLGAADWLNERTGSETVGHIGGAAVAGAASIPAGIAGAGLSFWDWLSE